MTAVTAHSVCAIQAKRFKAEMAEVTYPRVTEKILTNPVDGFGNHDEIMRLLTEDKSALKVYVNVAAE